MKPRPTCFGCAIIVLLVVILAAVHFTEGAISVDVTCTKQFCEDKETEQPCTSVPEECRNGSGFFMLYPSECNCCEYCLTYLKEGEICTIGMPGRPLPTAICGPGLSCYAADEDSEDEPVCKPMNTACSRSQREYDAAESSASLGIAAWRPLCDDDGFFAPAHCVPNGLCYCVERHSRGRIFGEMIFESRSQQKSMTCGCSRVAWTAEQLLGQEQVQRAGTARCQPDGSFDELQCVAGSCYCVNATTGQPLEDVKPVNVNDLVADSLPCFDPKRHKEASWETDCERERRTAFMDIAGMESEGIYAVGVQPPVCDPDGTYSRVQIRGSRKVCVDTKGNAVGNFSTPLNSELAVNMDCNCARTHLLMESEGRVDGLPLCCSSGDYMAWQCWRGWCYCVDAHGGQMTADVPASQLTMLPCWTADIGACATDDGQYTGDEETTTTQATTDMSSTTQTTTDSPE